MEEHCPICGLARRELQTVDDDTFDRAYAAHEAQRDLSRALRFHSRQGAQ